MVVFDTFVFSLEGFGMDGLRRNVLACFVMILKLVDGIDVLITVSRIVRAVK